MLEVAAWVTAHLLQPYVKKGQRITPKKLLGGRSPAQREADWQKVKEKLDKKGIH